MGRESEGLLEGLLERENTNGGEEKRKKPQGTHCSGKCLKGKGIATDDPKRATIILRKRDLIPKPGRKKGTCQSRN